MEITQQQIELVGSSAAAIDPERFARQVRRLGERHVRYGVMASRFDVVGGSGAGAVA